MPFFSLLFPAARAQAGPLVYRCLAEQAATIADWTGLVETAEAQRVAPLFYAHARAAGMALPEETRLQLQGLSLRHRLAGQVREQVLEQILLNCQSAGIEVVLLKGAALAHLVYPQPGLRPMRDIDLLARPAQVRDLQRLLLEMGFAPEQAQPGGLVSTRHLPVLHRWDAGFLISVEVHDHLFDSTWRARPLQIDAWMDRARPFAFRGINACSLRLEDMLWHIYQHMINEEIRLIGIADLISLSEQFVEEIDWAEVRREYPGVLAALSLFHTLVPLDEHLVSLAGLQSVDLPAGVGEDLQGWPRVPLGQARALGLGSYLRRTFWPSEWWLRLYYGIENGRSIAFYRAWRHPFEVLRLILKHLEVRLRVGK